MARASTLALALLVTGCFGSHSGHTPRDASVDGATDAPTTPACWPPAAAPGVVPCDLPVEDREDPCRCSGSPQGACVLYSTDRLVMHGYCFAGIPGPTHRPPAVSFCPGGLTLNYDFRQLSLEPYQLYADLYFHSYCVPPAECLAVRAYDTTGPDIQCIYGDYTIAETGVVPAPSCAERPGGLQMCSAGCACDEGYECGPYSEQHPWAPCYPTGTLVPSMPFDGAWMTRVLTPEQAVLNDGALEAERHYVDPAYCEAVAAAFPGLYACDSLRHPAP